MLDNSDYPRVYRNKARSCVDIGLRVFMSKDSLPQEYINGIWREKPGYHEKDYTATYTNFERITLEEARAIVGKITTWLPGEEPSKIKENTMIPTKKQVKNAIPVMRAWLDGKKIQARATLQGNEHWVDIEYPSWTIAIADYRIKQEPVDGWVNQYGTDDPTVVEYGRVYLSEQNALDNITKNRYIRTVHLTEIE